jgi:hypothetical protein
MMLTQILCHGCGYRLLFTKPCPHDLSEHMCVDMTIIPEGPLSSDVSCIRTININYADELMMVINFSEVGDMHVSTLSNMDQ